MISMIDGRRSSGTRLRASSTTETESGRHIEIAKIALTSGMRDMYLITLSKGWEATKTMIEKQY